MVTLVPPDSDIQQPQQDKYSPNFSSLVMGTPSLMTNESEKIRQDKLRNEEASRFLEGDFVEGENLTDAWFKFDLAGSKTLTAKQQKFKSKYPNGILTQFTLPSTNETKLIYKKNPNDKFRFLDIGVNYPEITRGLISGETIGGTIGSLRGIYGTAGGTGAGSLLETGLEKYRGYDVPPLADELKEAGVEGVIAGGFDAATRGAIKFFKALNNKGVASAIDTSKFADDISKFAEKEMLEPLAIGQVAKRPVVGSIYSQVGGTSPIPKDKTIGQVQSLKKNFGNISSKYNADDFTKEELKTVLKLQQDDFLKQVTSKFKTGTLSESFENSNSALNRGLQNWKETTRNLRNEKYTTAINSSDDFSFDLSDLQKTANEMQRAIIMKQKTQFQNKVVGTGLTDEGVETAITKSQKLPDKYTDVQNIPQEIQKEIDLILGLDPSVAKIQYKGQTFQPFEQMKALRTRLFNLQQSDNKNIARLSSDLYNSLKGVMDNPLTGSEDALQLYKEASQYNLYRENVLKVPFITKALKNNNPEDIVRLHFKNTQPSEVKLIKELVSPDQFDTLKNAYVYQMLNDTNSLNNFVKNIQLNKNTTKLMFNDEQISALENFQEAMTKLNKSQLAKSIEQDVSNFDRMLLLSDEGYEVLQNTMKLQGGKNSKFAQSVRAGLFKKILDDATIQDPQGGTEYLDTKKIYAGLDKIYKNKNLMELVFEKSDVKKLENFGLYTILVNKGQDVGGQIQVGELASSLASPLKPIKATSAYIKLKQNDFVAKILSQNYKPSSQNAYKKSNFLNANRLKELSIMVNSTAQQLNDEKKTKVLMNPNLLNIGAINDNK